jgi:ribosomal protein S18 acetylase RimI-like enzyme
MTSPQELNDKILSPVIQIVEANTSDDFRQARNVFQEYRSSFGASPNFQDFDREVSALPGDYAPPDGCLLIALYRGQVAGCVALRKFGDGICEMKRLYVRPQFRGLKIGRALTECVIQHARRLELSYMRLDTLPILEKALSLYRSIGFKVVAPYRNSPISDAIFMELELTRS